MLGLGPCTTLIGDVPSVTFCDYFFINEVVDTCSVLSIEEICDSAKNEKHEEAEDNFHADVSEHSPVPSLSDKIMVF